MSQSPTEAPKVITIQPLLSVPHNIPDTDETVNELKNKTNKPTPDVTQKRDEPGWFCLVCNDCYGLGDCGDPDCCFDCCCSGSSAGVEEMASDGNCFGDCLECCGGMTECCSGCDS